MFFTFPEDARSSRRWSSGVEIGEYAVWSGSHGGWFQRLLSERPSAERCVEVPLTTEWVTIAPAPDRYAKSPRLQ
jgi:hypothetical protein